MRSFWDSSWESIDPGRVADYIDTFDMRSDNMVTMLHQYDVRSVCDAGCGCGIYALKLAANGFSVSGFDVSAHAVEIAQALFEKTEYSADLKKADILATGYEDGQFDGVISRDVLDHIRKADAAIAFDELCRITRAGGIILFTLDSLDEEYKSEPHIVNADGDYLFTDGKWNGMVFHPYDREEVCEIIPAGVICEVMDRHGELTVLLIKEMKMEIKHYTKDRIPDVLQFERDLRAEESFWGWEIDDKYIADVTASFENPAFADSLSLLAYMDGKVVGRIDSTKVCSHFDGSTKAYLDWICVVKSCRHRGVAQALMEALRKELKGQGVDTLIGLIASNEDVQRFYRSLPCSEIKDEGIWIDL